MTWDGTQSTLPAINCYKTSAQSLVSGTSTAILFNTVRTASGGMTLDANGWVQVPRTGWYQVNGNVAFAASTSSARRIIGIASSSALPNFSALTGTIVASAQDTANITALQASTAVYLTSGTYVGVWGNALANWALEVTQQYNTTLSVAWLPGPA